MIRVILFLAAATLSAAAHPGDAQDVIRLWARQAGTWEGHIELYDPASAVPKTVALTTRWDATHDGSIVTGEARFLDGEASGPCELRSFIRQIRRP